MIIMMISMQYPRGAVPYPASEGGQAPPSKYLDEVRFPPKVSQHTDWCVGLWPICLISPIERYDPPSPLYLPLHSFPQCCSTTPQGAHFTGGTCRIFLIFCISQLFGHNWKLQLLCHHHCLGWSGSKRGAAKCGRSAIFSSSGREEQGTICQ